MYILQGITLCVYCLYKILIRSIFFFFFGVQIATSSIPNVLRLSNNNNNKTNI